MQMSDCMSKLYEYGERVVLENWEENPNKVDERQK